MQQPTDGIKSNHSFEVVFIGFLCALRPWLSSCPSPLWGRAQRNILISFLRRSLSMILMCMQNENQLTKDNPKVIVMGLFDLSASFDTIAHKLMLQKLSQNLSVAQLAWFKSYLTDITYFIHIHSSISPARPLA